MDTLADLELTDPPTSPPPVIPCPSRTTRPVVVGGQEAVLPGAAERMLTVAQRVRELSVKVHGPDRPVDVVGRSDALADLLGKIQKFARFNEPILITGESGVGKEFIASACHLLSRRVNKPFVSVNCPQYQEGNLTVSELFGHERGSFTGATGAHKGLFETADGGVIFLDEVGDLHPSAQTMLLRTLAEKEFKSLGATACRPCDVRVIAATNRPLRQLMADGSFREDLYFRLRYFPLQIPPLRERGGDWRLLSDHFLAKLGAEYGIRKSFSADSLRLLSAYAWPGNIRELKSLVAMAFSLSEDKLIEPPDFVAELGPVSAAPGMVPPASASGEEDLYRRMAVEKESFWEVIQLPFLDRDLNRHQVQAVVQIGLTHAHGSYRRAAEAFQIAERDYHKYMDFLRHHRLKPTV